MADNPNKRGTGDRDRVAGNEDYEVQYLSRQHNVPEEQVRLAIKTVGNNREKIVAYLKKAGHIK